MCDDLLEVLRREGVRQLPRLGSAGVKGRGIRRASAVGRGEQLARNAGRRLRLRGLFHCAESARMERGLPRLVASDQRSSAGRAGSLPRQRGDVATAQGGGRTHLPMIMAEQK